MSLGHLLSVIGEIDFVPDFCRFVLDSLNFDLRHVHSHAHHQQLGRDYYRNYRHRRYKSICPPVDLSTLQLSQSSL